MPANRHSHTDYKGPKGYAFLIRNGSNARKRHREKNKTPRLPRRVYIKLQKRDSSDDAVRVGTDARICSSVVLGVGRSSCGRVPLFELDKLSEVTKDGHQRSD